MNQKVNKLLSDCEGAKLQCGWGGLPTAEKLAKCLEALGGRSCGCVPREHQRGYCMGVEVRYRLSICCETERETRRFIFV